MPAMAEAPATASRRPRRGAGSRFTAARTKGAAAPKMSRSGEKALAREAMIAIADGRCGRTDEQEARDAQH